MRNPEYYTVIAREGKVSLLPEKISEISITKDMQTVLLLTLTYTTIYQVDWYARGKGFRRICEIVIQENMLHAQRLPYIITYIKERAKILQDFITEITALKYSNAESLTLNLEID